MAISKSTTTRESRHPRPALPDRYVERGHDCTLWFRVDRGPRTRLPNDPTTPKFKAAYSACLVAAIAAEPDGDDWSAVQ
jgi:hypothetical protein